MKKFFIIALFLVLALFVTGCNDKQPTPEEHFTEYVKLWNEQNFNKMYDYLSTEAQGSISKEEFTERYTKVYNDLEIQNVTVQFNPPSEETEKDVEQVQFPFHVKMDSIAGPIEFDHQAELVKEEKEDLTEWLLNWDTSFIFPELGEGDTISVPTKSPKRGTILDKNGIALAEMGRAVELGLVPGDMEGSEKEIIQYVSETLGVEAEKIEQTLSQSWVQPEHFVPLKTVAIDNTELIEEALKIPAVQKREVEARVYPLGKAAAHLTGNIGPITAEELEKNKGKNYSNTSLIGKRGLELVLEDRLRGEQGVKIVINKTDGTEVVLAEKDVVDGEDVQLTIDSALQRNMFDELKGKAGTAAAINPITGETLALVSSPSYDPNILFMGATNEEWKELEENPDNPMLNRFNSTFAPGSVLKPITAAIGLKEGVLNWETTIDIKDLTWAKDESWGSYKVKRVSNPGVPIDLEKALIYSDNIYFAQTTLELGKDKFTNGLKSFAFDEDMPFLYPMNTSQIGTIDSDIALADSSYGQGQVEMNVLHLAATYTPFTNEGNMIKPILEVNEEKGQVWKENVMSAEQAKNLSTALRKVIEDPHGTGRAARIEGYPLVGKTGTAEYAKGNQDEEGKENGWFVAYNPENPEAVVALMVEEDSSRVAVEKVKNIFTQLK